MFVTSLLSLAYIDSLEGSGVPAVSAEPGRGAGRPRLGQRAAATGFRAEIKVAQRHLLWCPEAGRRAD